MPERRGKGQRGGLAQAADRGEFHRLGDVGHGFQRIGPGVSLQDRVQQLDQVFRARTAGHALTAGLVAEECHCVPGHIHHVRSFGQHDDRPGAQHGTNIGERFEIQGEIRHGRRQETR